MANQAIPPSAKPQTVINMRAMRHEAGDAMMTAEEFRAAKEKLGWSIHKASHELGRHPSTICRYQAGEVPVPHIVKTLINMKLEAL